MNYRDTIDYLYTSLPMFQQVGSAAYKEGLENTLAFDRLLGHPHTAYRSIHVAGTNGKGSTSHLLAAILQSAGYRVGLYTSPHLTDFRERVRMNGIPIPEKAVIDFVETYRSFFEEQHLSFFEMSTALAFRYFADEKVDFAVIEVGLGGRLDCTNIISPVLSVITNISFDHVRQLGGTLEKIATEKAGIIKKNTPVVIGEKGEVEKVFIEKARQMEAPLFFAEEAKPVSRVNHYLSGWEFEWRGRVKLETPLSGLAQEKNAATVLTVVEKLQENGVEIPEESVINGFKDVISLTGLRGRWERLQERPTVICDTGHNAAGIGYIAKQLGALRRRKLRIIFGMVDDKDIREVLGMLPENAVYYFTQASVKRALNASQLRQMAASFGLKGECYPSVAEAIGQALQDAASDDLIFIGGSTFVVADALLYYERERMTS